MRKAKNIVMVFLALVPLLWILLVCTTGIMGDRKSITEYSFGSVVVSSDVITYTPGSPCESILSTFIPSGTSLDSLQGGVKACYNLAAFFSSAESMFFPGSSGAPNALLLLSLLYFFWLFVLELSYLCISVITLPVRLCSRWLDGVR